ncbi:MAG: hypothetical protein IJ685_10420, partial [Selenomonadaceae bacterium]|nr:hypothetical protein [Selenomonadaceae bacterium]
MDEFIFDLQRFDGAVVLTMGTDGKLMADGTVVNKTTSTAGGYYTLSAGDYELGGDIDLNGAYLMISTGTVTLNLGTHQLSTSNANRVVYVKDDGNLTVNGTGSIVASNNASAGIFVYSTDQSKTAKLTVNGGTITGGSSSFGICGNGTAGAGKTEITISGGTISGAVGIYHPQDGTLKISGGTITGTDDEGSGIEIRSGTLNVSGGTISSTADEYSVEPNNNGTTTAGAGIAIAQHTTKKAINVSITGGKISGQVAVSVANPNKITDASAGKISVSVSGGTLTSSLPTAIVNTDDRTTTTLSVSGAEILNADGGKALTVTDGVSEVTATDGKTTLTLAEDATAADVKLNVPDNADVSAMEIYIGEQLYTPVKTGDNVGLIATTDTTDGITIAADSTAPTESTFRVRGVNSSYQDYTITVAKTATGDGDIAGGDIGNGDGEEETTEDETTGVDVIVNSKGEVTATVPAGVTVSDVKLVEDSSDLETTDDIEKLTLTLTQADGNTTGGAYTNTAGVTFTAGSTTNGTVTVNGDNTQVTNVKLSTGSNVTEAVDVALYQNSSIIVGTNTISLDTATTVSVNGDAVTLTLDADGTAGIDSFTLGSTSGTKFTAESGTVAVTLDSTKETLTFDTTGDAITVGENYFKYTDGGILMGTSATALTKVFNDDSATSIDLKSGKVTDTDWQAIVLVDVDETKKTTLTLKSETFSTTAGEVIVMDSAGTVYATLSGSEDDGYTITPEDNSTLTSIVLDEDVTSLKFAKAFAGKTTTITAGGAVFTVTTATKDFTVTSEDDSVSVDNFATAIALTSGTLTVPKNQTVTAGTSAIKATLGDGITVTVDSGTVTIGELNEGDKFTVGSDTYTYTKDGLTNANGDSWLGSDDVSTNGVTVADLAEEDNWSSVTEVTNKEITITDSTESTIYATTENGSTTRIAKLTVSSDGTKTLVPYDSTTQQNSTGLKGYTVTVNGTAVTFNSTYGGDNAPTIKTNSGAEFTVTTASDDFTVTDKTGSPAQITNATAITLNGGKIELNNGQTVTFGSTGTTDTLKATADGFVVSYDSTKTTTTITAPKSATEFTFDNQKYTAGSVDNPLVIEKTSDGTTVTAKTDSTFTYTPTTTTTDGTTTEGDGGGGDTSNPEDSGDTTKTVTIVTSADGIVFDGTTFSDFEKGESFKIGSITYTVGTNGLISASDGSTAKIYMGDGFKNNSIAASELIDKNFVTLIKGSDKLSIDTSTLTANGSAIIVDNVDNPTKQYGFLTSDASGNYSITQSTDNKLLGGKYTDVTSVTIDLGFAKKHTVTFGKEYANMSISIGNTKIDSVGSVSGADFSVGADNDYLHASYVKGAGIINFNLKNDSSDLPPNGYNLVRASTSDQTIVTSGRQQFSISGSSVASLDGVIIIDSKNGTYIDDIDIGEDFTINGTKYTYNKDFGLITQYGVYTSKIDTHSDRGRSVNYESLTAATNWEGLIAPDSNKVLALDSTLASKGVIVDNNTAPTAKYGTFTNNSGTITVTNENFATTGGLSISVDSSAEATFTGFNNAQLNNITFIAEKSGATFKVTNASGNFTVSGKDAAPTITGATAITLLDGTITATNGQKITLDDGDSSTTDKVLEVTGGNLTVAYDKTNKVWTVAGDKGDTFTYDGKTYAVDNGEMTFTLSDGKASISGVDNGEVFAYDGQEYSLKSGTGLLTSISGGNYKALSTFNGSIAADSLSGTDDWTGIVTISSSSKTASVPTGMGGLSSAIIMDDDFNAVYASISAGKGSDWSLGTSQTDDSLAKISLGASVGAVSLGSYFANDSLTITAADVADFTVTDDSTPGFVVSVSGGNASVEGATSASLINGSLTADSTSSVIADKYIVQELSANDNIVVIRDGSDVSVGGIGKNESIKVGADTYTMTDLGITDKDGKLLVDTKTDADKDFTLDLSSLTSGDWKDLITVDGGLSVDANSSEGLIVDKNKTSIYGSLTGDSVNGYTFTEGANSWAAGAASAVSINNTTLTLPENYSSVKAIQSKAEFSVTDSDADSIYTVTDSSLGAAIAGADSITQTAGTILLSDSAQSVTANNSVVSFASLNGTAGDGTINVAVDGTSVSIGGLDAGESFNVGGETYSVTGGNKLINAKNQLWQNSVTGGVVDVASLADGWLGQITVSGGKLDITAANASIASVSTDGAYVVDSTNSDIVYGTLISVTGGSEANSGYSLSTVGASKGASLSSIDIGDIFYGGKGKEEAVPFKFAKDFANILITAGENTFVVTDKTKDFTVKYQTKYPELSVDGATKVSLQSGEITASDENQSIVTGSDTITAAKGLIIANAGNVSISNIGVANQDADNKFVVNGTSYQYISGLGLVKTDTNAASITGVVGSANFDSLTSTQGTFAGGVFKVDGAKIADAIALDNDSLDLSKIEGDAVVLSSLDPKATPTKLADLDYTSANGTTTLNIQKVTGYKDEIKSVTLAAENTELVTDFAVPTVTTSAHNSKSLTYTIGGETYKPYKVNASDTASSSSITVAVTAAGTSFTSALTGGTVVLTKDDSVKVSDGTKTNEIKATDGDGMTVNVNNDKTVTVNGLNEGDKFTVGDVNSTDDPKEYQVMSGTLIEVTGEYLWKGDSFTDGVTLNALGTTGNWLKIRTVTNGELEITDKTFKDGNTELTEVDLYDLKNGITYGKLTKNAASDGKVTYTLTKSAGDNDLTSITLDGTTFSATPTNNTLTITPATETDALKVSDTNSVTLESGAIDASVPVKADNYEIAAANGATVTVTKDTNGVTVSGIGTTDDKFTVTKTGDTAGTTYQFVENFLVATNGTTITGVVSDGFTYEEDDEGKTDGIFTLSKAETTSAIAPDAAKNISLTTAVSADGSYIVLNTLDPTATNITKISNLEVSGTTYTFTNSDETAATAIEKLTLTKAAATVTTDFDTTVSIPAGSATFEINGNKFAALKSALEIQTGEGDGKSTLTSGTVKLDKDDTVTITKDDKIIEATDGNGMTVKVDANVTTLTGLSADDKDAFKVGDTQYTMKGIGLTTGSKLWTEETANEFTLTDLADKDKWSDYALAGTGETYTISDSTSTVIIVDSDESARIAKLDNGTLKNIGDTVTLEEITIGNGVTATLAKEFADEDVKIKIGTDTEFTATSTGNFIVNATDKTVSGATAVTLNSGSLTMQGYNSTTAEVPITADGYEISKLGLSGTGTSNTIGVSVTESNGDKIVTVDGIDTGEYFTVTKDGKSTTYKKTSAGLIAGTLDGTNTNFTKIDGVVKAFESISSSINLSEDMATVALAPDGNGKLDLSNLTAADTDEVKILDSDTAPTKVIGTLKKDDTTGVYSLTTTTDYNKNIQSIALGTSGTGIDKLSVAIADITINTDAKGGNYTVNGIVYNATGALEILTTATESTLTAGTVTLDDTDAPKVTGSANDQKLVEVTSGKITAKATTGAITLSGIDKTEKFTVDDTTEYTMNGIGLTTTDDSKVTQVWSDAATSEFAVADLDTDTNWLKVETTPLTISAKSETSVVADKDLENRIANLEKTSNGNYTLTKGTAGTLDKVTVDAVTVNFDKDFANDLEITATNAKFTVTGLTSANDNFTVTDATTGTTLTNAAKVSLTDGTLSDIDKATEITAGGKTITAGDTDKIDITVNGTSVTIGGIKTPNETFTVTDGEGNTTTYKYINSSINNLAKMNDDGTEVAAFCDNFNSTDGTYSLDNEEFTKIIAPDDKGNLELDEMDDGDEIKIYNSVSNPTEIYATLKYTDANGYELEANPDADDDVSEKISTVTLSEPATLTTDFDTNVETAKVSGNFTVNGNTYNAKGTDALTIAATIDDDDNATSTLTTGTVTLDATNKTVNTTAGKEITAGKVGSGDGQLTVTATKADATAGTQADATITDFGTGDTATIDGTTYTNTDVGFLSKAKDSNVYKFATITGDITVSKLENANDWTPAIATDSTNFTLNASTIPTDYTATDETVVLGGNIATAAVTENYGTIKLDGTKFTFTLADDDVPDKITVADNYSVDVAADMTKFTDGINFDAQKANFTVKNADVSGDDVANFDDDTSTFNVDATGTAKVTGDNISVTLNSGTLDATKDLDVKVGDNTVTVTAIETGNNSVTVINNGGNLQVGALNTGDKFTINGVEYKMSDIGLLKNKGSNWVAVDESNVSSEGDVATYTYTEEEGYDLVAVTNGAIDLSGVTGDKAKIVDKLPEGETTPEKTYAILEKTGNTWTIEKGTDWTNADATAGTPQSITEITIGGDVTDLTTKDFGATVKTTATADVTVNGTAYSGTGALTITAAADGKTSTLDAGTVTLDEDHKSVTPTGGDAITLSTGDDLTVAVTAATGTETSPTVEISGFDDGDKFKIGTANEFTMGGLTLSNGSKLWIGTDLNADNARVTVTALTTDSDNWATAIQAKDGNLTVDDKLTEGGIIVDSTSSPSESYGLLTKTTTTDPETGDDVPDGGFKLTASNFEKDDSTLDTLTVTGKKLTIDKGVDISSTEFVANGAEISELTPVDDTDVVIDATGTAPAKITGVETITLDKGTLAATENVAINDITLTSGTMTVTADGDGKTTINPENGATFTYENTKYTFVNDKVKGLISDGKLYAPADLTQDINDIVSEENYLQMVAATVDGTNVTLTLQDEDDLGDNGVIFVTLDGTSGNPTATYATQDTDNNFALTNDDDKNTYTIDASDLEDEGVMTVQFEATVNLPAGQTATVNGVEYDANTAITVSTTYDATGSEPVASSELTSGTVNLTAGGTDSVTIGGNTIEYTGNDDNGMTVNVNGETVTLGGLANEGDAFTVTDKDGNKTTYEIGTGGALMQTFAEGSGKPSEQYTDTEKFTGGAIALTDLLGKDGWLSVIPLDDDGVLNLSDVTAGGTVTSADYNKHYATLTIGEDKKLTLTKITEESAGDTKDIKSINLGGATKTLTVDFAATVTTTEPAKDSTATFTVNGNAFTPESSALTITIGEDTKSYLADGKVSISGTETLALANDVTVDATSGKTVVTVTADEEAGTTTTTYSPAENAEFAIGETEYKMTAVGLTKDGKEIWTDDTVTENYDINAENVWSTMKGLDSDGALDLSGDNKDLSESNVIVDSTDAPTTRYGTLGYDKDTNTFTVESADTTFADKQIKLGTADATLTTNFNATVKTTYTATDTTDDGTDTTDDGTDTTDDGTDTTDDGTDTTEDGTDTTDDTGDADEATSEYKIQTYKVNGKTFKAASSALEIAATYTAPANDGEATSDATLTSGKVKLYKDDSVDTTVPIKDEINNVTATAGDGLTVEVKDGKVTVGSLNEKDTFKIGDVEYTVRIESNTQMLERSDTSASAGDNNKFQLDVTDDEDDGLNNTFKVVIDSKFFDDANWGGVIEAKKDEPLDLTETTIENGSSNVVTEDGEKIARITNNDGTYEITDNTGLDEVAIGEPVKDITTDGHSVTVTTPEVAEGADGEIYTVNGEKFDAQDKLEIAATPERDENGDIKTEPVLDDEGNPVKDDDGKPVTKPVTTATLSDGTVALTGDTTAEDGTTTDSDTDSVTPTGGEKISAGKDSAVTVAANKDDEGNTSATVGDIDSGETFSVGNDTYTAKTIGEGDDSELILTKTETDEDGNKTNKILSKPIDTANPEVTTDTLGEDDNWLTALPTETDKDGNNILTIDKDTTNGLVVDDDEKPAEVFGEISNVATDAETTPDSQPITDVTLGDSENFKSDPTKLDGISIGDNIKAIISNIFKGVAITATAIYNGATTLANFFAPKSSDTGNADGETSDTFTVTTGGQYVKVDTDVTLTDGTIGVNDGQVITVGEDTFTAGNVNDNFALVYKTTATDTSSADGDIANFEETETDLAFTNIAVGDDFDLNGKKYLMTDVGLFVVEGDTLKEFVTAGIDASGKPVTSILKTDLAATQPLLAVASETVTLSGATTDATKYTLVDSTSAASISKRFGTLEKSGTTYTLTKDTTYTSGISTIAAAAENATINSDLSSVKVTTAAGTNTYTVNGKEFTAASTVLEITATYTAATTASPVTQGATLDAGIVTIAAGKEVTDTKNGSAISVPSTATGSVTATATAADGFTSIGDIATGETFTVTNGTNVDTYVMTTAGLYNSNDKALVTTGVTTTDNVSTYTFSTAKETPTIVIADKALDLTSVTTDGDYVIVDAATPTAQYGKVTKAGTTYTFASENLTSDIVSTVNVGTGATVTTDFATQVLKDAGTTSGVLTVNGKTYNAATVDDGNASSLIIDAAADGTTSTLRVGLVTLNTTYPTVTGTDGNVVTVTSGELSVLGFFPLSSTLTLLNIDNADAFKVNGKDYIMTTAGLFADTTNGKLWTNNDTPVTGGVAVSDLTTGGNWTQMVAAPSDTLALDTAATVLNDTTNPVTSVAVVDSLTDPQKDYGRASVASGVYTVNKTSDNTLLTSITLGTTASNVKTDFDTKVTAAASTTPTVNGNKFSVTAAATFSAKADGTTATLDSGTVALDATTYTKVTDTSASKTITCTGGDGITFNATNDTIGGITTVGDKFTVTTGTGDTATTTEYEKTALGLVNNSDGQIWTDGDYSSVTLTQLA